MKKLNKRLFKVATVVGSIMFAIMSFVPAMGFSKTKIVKAENNANVTLPYTIQTTNWATAPTHGATTPITVNAVEETLKDGDKLYGYKLSSGNTYSSAVMSANTSNPMTNAVTKEAIVINGYSMPYCQDLTFGIDQAINRNETVEFLMSPMVKGGQGVDYSTRFVMAMSDKAGRVHGLTSKTKNGFNTDGNFFSWDFANDQYTAYDNRQQQNGPKVWETNSVMKAESEATNTTVGQYTTSGTTTSASTIAIPGSWLSNAFYGLPEYRNSTNNDSVTYNGSEMFVRVRISFTDTSFTIVIEHVYKDKLSKECTYANHESSCKFTRTYDISNIDFGDDLKLYFGYYNTNVRFTESQLGESGVKRHEIPMSLGIYNYKNGDVRSLEVKEDKESVSMEANEELSISDVLAVNYFDGITAENSDATISFASTNDAVAIVENGKIKALSSGDATITATCSEGQTASFNVHVHGYGEDLIVGEDTHWSECACSAKGGETAHEFNQEIPDAKYLVSAATCTAKAVYKKSCICGLAGEETFEYGEFAEHSFEEVVDAEYLVSAATCTAKAVYKKSCACGLAGEETFETGDFAEHSFEEVVDDEYLVSAATCTAKAVYKKSCVCGLAGEETFEDGETVACVADEEWQCDGTSHWKVCAVCGTEIEGSKANHKAVEGTITVDWRSDENGHWQVCVVCEGKMAEGEHVYLNDCDKSCETCNRERDVQAHVDENEDGVCDICEEEITASESQPESTVDSNDDGDSVGCMGSVGGTFGGLGLVSIVGALIIRRKNRKN